VTGEFRPAKRPDRMADVNRLSLVVDDRLQRGGSALTGGVPGLAGSGASGSVKRDAGLGSDAAAASAVRFETARALQRDSAGVDAAARQARDGDVQSGIKHAPSGLREELQRVAVSNARVHAPGELAALVYLPPGAETVRAAVAKHVADAIVAAAAGDATSQWAIPAETAEALAARLLARGVRETDALGDFVTADRAMRGAAAPEATSTRAIVGAWALAKRGIEALQACVFGVTLDPALAAITNMVDPSLRAQRLDAVKVRTWLERVLSSWCAALKAFRHGGRPPSLQAAVDAHSTFLLYNTFASAAGDALAAAQKGREHLRPPCEDDDDEDEPARATKSKRKKRRKEKPGKRPPREKERPTREREKPSPTGDKESVSAWPDRPRWDDGTWAKVRQKVATKFPKHCMWYLVAKCTRPDCGRLHETPDDFDSFKAEFATAGDK
jgi:hypothetical protein